MMKSARCNVAFLLLSHVVGYAFAHSYFIADLKTENGTSVGNVEAFIHDGEWAWEANSTVPLSTMAIVDRRGDAANPEFTDLVDLSIIPQDTPVGDMYQYEGTFDDGSIEVENKPSLFKEERNMTNALQLAGHMCMGHIFILATDATDGSNVYGPLMYAKDGDCYEGTKTTSMRMPMGGMSMGASANGTMDHSHDNDHGEDHSMAAETSGDMFTTISWSLAAMIVVSMT